MEERFIYTFRTFPISESEVFVFCNFKQDLKRFFEILNQQPAKQILGIGNGKLTHYEKVAVNKLHKTKRILANAPDSYDLFIPDGATNIATQASDSFCNWTAYQIAHFVKSHELPIKVSFLHVSPKDISKIKAEFSLK